MAWWMATAWAVTLGTVPVSGQVTGADGLPLEGTHTVTVSLYDAASGGAPWWDDDQSVAFVGGAFQVLLGAGPTALDIEAFAAHGPPWVSVAVDGVASERVATGWVPRAAVAFRANSASSADAVGAILAEDVATTASVASVATDLSSLSTSVSGIGQTVTGLDQTVTGLDQTVTGLSQSVTGLNTTVAGLGQVVSGPAIQVPAGTTGQRPAGATTGAMRWNTTLSTMEVYDGTRWLNVNTPPIGSTYIQWASASAPQAIWPNTQWVSSDFDDGSFLRSRGGNANVGASGSLTGTTQTGALETHGHALSGGVTNAGALNTASASADHTHGWGGVWNIDNSNAVNNPTNGDGSGNTYSDAHGYWNRWIGGSTSTNGNHAHTAYAPVHDTNSSASQGYPNGDNHQSFRSSDRGRDRGITSAAMSAEGNHAHDVFYYNHRHWIAPRTTGGASSTSHAHSLPAHGHANDFAVGAPNSGAVASETRPQNKAAIFWRRIN